MPRARLKSSHLPANRNRVFHLSPNLNQIKLKYTHVFFVHWKTPCHLLVLFSPNKIMKRRGGMIKKKSNCKEEPNWWQGIISIFFPAEWMGTGGPDPDRYLEYQLTHRRVDIKYETGGSTQICLSSKVNVSTVITIIIIIIRSDAHQLRLFTN